MAEMLPYFQKTLSPDEQLISIVESLKFNIVFAPTNFLADFQCSWGGALGLTNRRIKALINDGNSWKWFSTSAINGLSERHITSNQPTWPYQAFLMVAGGMGLVVQTLTPNPEQAEQLSSLLNQAFMQFTVRREDDGAITAIVAHEEEKARRQRE